VTPIQAVLLALRVTVEVGVVGGLAWWGFETGGGGALGILLAVVAPAIGFGVWGAVDFHQVGRHAEALRLAEELVISGLAAGALVAAGQPGWGLALLTVSLAYHGLVYAAGERLLRDSPAPPHRQDPGEEPA
jgi:Protein of unknown function (DUF2568)